MVTTSAGCTAWLIAAARGALLMLAAMAAGVAHAADSAPAIDATRSVEQSAPASTDSVTSLPCGTKNRGKLNPVARVLPRWLIYVIAVPAGLALIGGLQIAYAAMLIYPKLPPLGRNEAGARASLPIWMGYMEAVLKAMPERAYLPPAGVVTASIMPKDDQQVATGGDGSRDYLYQENVEPTLDPAAPSQPNDKVRDQLF